MHKFVEVAEMVFRLETGVPGKILAIVGGVHGNELTGIRVVQQIKKDVEIGKINTVCGTLILALGNLRAILLNERGSEQHADLNRSFSAKILDGVGNDYESKRARELTWALQDVEIGIDIHATNKPSEPFVVCQTLPDARYQKIYRWFKAQKVLTDPRMIFAGEPVTLDEHFARDGRIGICYETGQAGDTARVREVQHEIENLLVDVGMVERRDASAKLYEDKEIFELITSIKLEAPGAFRYTSSMGTYNLQPVGAGEIIGYMYDEPIVAEVDNIIVFPKILELWEVGKPVGYLARRV